MEVQHIFLHGSALSFRARVYLALMVISCTASDIDDVTAHAVVASYAVGNLPTVHIGIFIVLNKTLPSAVKVEHICVTHLLPATTTLRHRVSVPVTDVIRCHFTASRCVCAVDYQILQLVCHSLRFLMRSQPLAVLQSRSW